MSNLKKIAVDGLKTSFFLGLGILLIWLAVKDLSTNDRNEIIASFKQANVGVVLLVLLIGILSNLSRAIRWQLMIEPLGKKPGLATTFMAVMAGYLANLAVPRLGEVTRCGVLKKYENIPLDGAIGTVVIERLIDLVLLAIVSVITLVWQFDVLSATLKEAYVKLFGDADSTSAGMSLKLIVLIGLALLGIVLLVFRKKLLNTPLALKLKTILQGFSEGLQTISKLKSPGLFVFHSVLIWFLYFLGIYVGFHALPETSSLGAGAGFSILFFGTFAFIIVQGGIGAYQIIVQNTLVVYGISSNVGYALGWIIWSTQTAGIIVLGLLSLLILPIYHKRKTI